VAWSEQRPEVGYIGLLWLGVHGSVEAYQLEAAQGQEWPVKGGGASTQADIRVPVRMAP
jgi:hypothetical protein